MTVAVAARAIPVAAGQLKTGIGIYRGFTLRETSGTNPAVVQIFDNTAGSGTLLETVQLPAGSSQRFDYTAIWYSLGMFVVITGTGTVEGSILIG
jgi:hypothetical protein